MARWTILPKEEGTKLKLVYRNSRSGAEHCCGVVKASTAIDDIVDWIVELGGSNPGDLIVLPDRSVLQLSLHKAQA